MRICIIAEGAYPYITGGVSNWIHQLVNNLHEHDFVIITIMPDSKKRGDFGYELPPNIIKVHEVFFDEFAIEKWTESRNAILSEEDLEVLGNLISFKDMDWSKLFSLFQKKEIRKLSGLDIYKSWSFYNKLKETYMDKYSHIAFTQVYWTLKSMYVLLFNLLLQDYPDADIYHAVSTGYAGFIGAYAAKTRNKPFLLSEHGIYTREREEEIIKADWVKGYLKDIWIKYFYQISDCVYKNADKVIALFDYYKEIQIEIGCPEKKIQVIPNGINIDEFKEVARDVSQRTDKDGINIGAVVRLVPIKDIITMLEAFSYVSREIPDAHFYIMGPTDEDQEYYEECVKFKDYLKLVNVIFTGKIDIKEYLGKMDLLVLTSISEGQPLVLLEGFACKLPFVSTNVGDCKSLILGEKDDFGPAGRVLKAMDSSGIGDAIVELCTDRDLRRACGEAGYKRVKEFYKFDTFINRYRNIYNDMIGSDNSGRYWI